MTADKQGEYSKTKIRKTIEDVGVKKQIDSGFTKELDNSKSEPPATPFIIARPTTTISFATTPKIIETIIPTLANPNGLNRNDNFELTKYKIEFSNPAYPQYLNPKVKFCKNHNKEDEKTNKGKESLRNDNEEREGER